MTNKNEESLFNWIILLEFKCNIESDSTMFVEIVMNLWWLLSYIFAGLFIYDTNSIQKYPWKKMNQICKEQTRIKELSEIL